MTSQTLIAIHVGPVKDFIRAARKTRDLWFGSHVLSEISKAVARTLVDCAPNGCGLSLDNLIFPAPAKKEDLDQESQLNVANVILVLADADKDAKTICDKAREAAKAEFKRFADAAKSYVIRKLGGEEQARSAFRMDVWDEQVDDVIEFYAAWTPVGDSIPYRGARRRVMQLLTGRKATRDFTQAKGHEGIPKSSLDGARESVLGRNSRDGAGIDLANSVRARLRLRPGEQLDCVGLTKRLATADSSDEQPFPSLARVAAESWLQRLLPAEVNDLEKAAKECRKIVHPLPDDTQRFPFEGTVLFLNRHREFQEEFAAVSDETKRALNVLREKIRELQTKYGEPDPYVAVLRGDGDAIGEAITTLSSHEQHQKFSIKLANFAAEAASRVKANGGTLIFSGGDDVLALLPVSKCVECARDLRKRFSERMTELWRELSRTYDSPPTFSVGISIGHFMEPMEFLLEFAEEAEIIAKHSGPQSSHGDDEFAARNALAVSVQARGNATITCRGRWDWDHRDSTSSMSLDERLLTWTRLLAMDALPHRAAYQLRQIAVDFSDFPRGNPADERRGKHLLIQMALRMLQRKEAKGDEETVAEAKDLMRKIIDQSVHTSADLYRLADELLIARRMYLSSDLSSGGTKTENEDEDESLTTSAGAI